jgi:hypothetical protein
MCIHHRNNTRSISHKSTIRTCVTYTYTYKRTETSTITLSPQDVSSSRVRGTYSSSSIEGMVVPLTSSRIPCTFARACLFLSPLTETGAPVLVLCERLRQNDLALVELDFSYGFRGNWLGEDAGRAIGQALALNTTITQEVRGGARAVDGGGARAVDRTGAGRQQGADES